MQKRRKIIARTIRENRKACLNEMGKGRFKFDWKDEFRTYQYMCCGKMKKRDWEKCHTQDMPHSYSKWKEGIRTKYMEYNAEQLEEFRRYLELKARNEGIIKENANIFLNSTLSGAFATLMGLDVSLTIGITNNKEMPMAGITFIIFIITAFAISIAIVMIFMIVKIMNPIGKCAEQQSMFKDYQEVISLLIEEKKIEESVT